MIELNLTSTIKDFVGSDWDIQRSRIESDQSHVLILSTTIPIAHLTDRNDVIKDVIKSLNNMPHFKSLEEDYKFQIEALQSDVSHLRKYKTFYDLYKGLKESK